MDVVSHTRGGVPPLLYIRLPMLDSHYKGLYSTIMKRTTGSRDVPVGVLTNGLDMAELGIRIREERARRQLGLEELSQRCAVSRSMLSAVERGQKVPTVLVLDRIATGLGTSLARLLGKESKARVTVLRHKDQDVVRDPAGWQRRILSPVLPGVEFELMRTTIKPGVDAGVFNPHDPGSREYVAVERGTLRLTINGDPILLNAGDSIYYDGDCRHGFANPGRGDCIYYLAMDVADRSARATHHPVPARSASQPNGKRKKRSR